MSKKYWYLFFTGLAATMWLTLALVHLVYDRSLNGWLLGVQFAITAVAMVFRRDPKSESSSLYRWIAWLGAVAPLAVIRVGEFSPGLAAIQIGGMGIAVWALISLGGSFGIAPADRGLIMKGPYKVLRHPAYLGELIGMTAAALTGDDWLWWNLLALIVLCAAMVIRIREEEKIVGNYNAYVLQVRWKMIPRLW